METVITSPETAADAPVRPSSCMRCEMVFCAAARSVWRAVLSYSLPVIGLNANVSAFAALVVAESFTAKAVVNSIMAASRPLKMRFVNFKILSPF